MRQSAGGGGTCRDVLLLHHRQHRPGGGSGQRLAAERGGVVARLEGGGDVRPGPAGADGDAVAERLGHRDDVRLDAHVLEGEPPTGAAEPGLHLVDHEQGAPLVAQAADPLQVRRGGRLHATLALHRLEQHGRHRGAESGVEGVEVVPGGVPEALGQGLERLVLGRLPGGVEGGEGAAVEAAEGADHDVLAPAAPAA